MSVLIALALVALIVAEFALLRWLDSRPACFDAQGRKRLP